MKPGQLMLMMLIVGGRCYVAWAAEMRTLGRPF